MEDYVQIGQQKLLFPYQSFHVIHLLAYLQCKLKMEENKKKRMQKKN